MFKLGLVVDCKDDDVLVLVRYGRRISWHIPSSLQRSVTVRRSFLPSLQVYGRSRNSSSVVQNVSAGGSITMSGGDVYVAGGTSTISRRRSSPSRTVTVTIRKGTTWRARNFGGEVTDRE